MAFGNSFKDSLVTFGEQNKETLIKEYGQYLLEMKKFKVDINLFVTQLYLQISVLSLQINKALLVVRCLLNQSF